jgi:hypothetical protein
VTNEYASPLIRAELIGSDTCIALGIRATGDSPILKLCRLLIKAGHDPDSPLHVYRGATLALTVSSIGEGAALRATTTVAGRPIFKPVYPHNLVHALGSQRNWLTWSGFRDCYPAWRGCQLLCEKSIAEPCRRREATAV